MHAGLPRPALRRATAAAGWWSISIAAAAWQALSASAARGGDSRQTAEERRRWLEDGGATRSSRWRGTEKPTQEGPHRRRCATRALGPARTTGAQRIECFDISHTMGEAAVASCVVYRQACDAEGGVPPLNMREPTPGDDYAAMRQALTRRYERVLADEGKVPDLILIDGGRGQLNAARAALAELGMNDVMVVGVAKGPERKAGMEELVL
ncbi:MAG: hypothetical protein U5L03_06610 [Burkholderiaceae bacterium]|nr:hypothetical protein [Burkholderiaceae bacterium]